MFFKYFNQLFWAPQGKVKFPQENVVWGNSPRQKKYPRRGLKIPQNGVISPHLAALIESYKSQTISKFDRLVKKLGSIFAENNLEVQKFSQFYIIPIIHPGI